MRNPKLATVAEIRAHWALKDDATVRKILREKGLRPAETGPARYRWADVWALEGAGWVARADEAAFKAPLRAPDELRDFFDDTPVRTITDWARKGKIPAIPLGAQWRFRAITLERARDHV